MKDKELESKVLAILDRLERTNDWCGDTPVRREISEHIVAIRRLVKGPVTKGYE